MPGSTRPGLEQRHRHIPLSVQNVWVSLVPGGPRSSLPNFSFIHKNPSHWRVGPPSLACGSRSCSQQVSRISLVCMTSEPEMALLGTKSQEPIKSALRLSLGENVSTGRSQGEGKEVCLAYALGKKRYPVMVTGCQTPWSPR